MGGKALKNIETKRCSTEELYKNREEVIKILKDKFPDIMASGVNFYKDKKDHGDIDIVIALNRLNDYKKEGSKSVLIWNQIMDEVFEPKESKFSYNKKEESQCSIYSFEYNDIQVDLIKVDEDSFDFAFNYYSYNDLVGIISNVYHNLGFKFGYDGLKYMVNLDKSKNKPVFLTKNFEEALSFGGYDYERFKRGFKNFEEGILYVESSSYFSPHFFDLEKRRNRESYKRDLKRNMMMKFFNHIEGKYNFEVYYEPDLKKELNRAKKEFPHLESNIFKKMVKDQIEKEEEYLKNYFKTANYFKEFGIEKSEIKRFVDEHLKRLNMTSSEWSNFIEENYKNSEIINEEMLKTKKEFNKKKLGFKR